MTTQKPVDKTIENLHRLLKVYICCVRSLNDDGQLSLLEMNTTRDCFNTSGLKHAFDQLIEPRQEEIENIKATIIGIIRYKIQTDDGDFCEFNPKIKRSLRDAWELLCGSHDAMDHFLKAGDCDASRTCTVFLSGAVDILCRAWYREFSFEAENRVRPLFTDGYYESKGIEA